MSKSTPISQLPQEVPAQMPSQMQQDMLNDDDATIQEVLNSINSPQDPPSAQQYDMNAMMNAGYYPPHQQIGQGSPLLQPQLSQPMFAQQLKPPGFDFKLVILFAICYIAANVIPVEQILFKYVAIDKIPYGTLLVKATVAGTMAVFLKRYFNM